MFVKLLKLSGVFTSSPVLATNKAEKALELRFLMKKQKRKEISLIYFCKQANQFNLPLPYF